MTCQLLPMVQSSYVHEVGVVHGTGPMEVGNIDRSHRGQVTRLQSDGEAMDGVLESISRGCRK